MKDQNNLFKTYTQKEARQMNNELDLLHELITEIYNDDTWRDLIKETLDKIELRKILFKVSRCK